MGAGTMLAPSVAWLLPWLVEAPLPEAPLPEASEPPVELIVWEPACNLKFEIKLQEVICKLRIENRITNRAIWT